MVAVGTVVVVMKVWIKAGAVIVVEVYENLV